MVNWATRTIVVTARDPEGEIISKAINVTLVTVTVTITDIGIQYLPTGDGLYFGDFNLTDIFQGAVEYSFPDIGEHVREIYQDGIESGVLVSGQWFSFPEIRMSLYSINAPLIVEAKDEFGNIFSYEFKFADVSYAAELYVIGKNSTVDLNYFESDNNNQLTFSIEYGNPELGLTLVNNAGVPQIKSGDITGVTTFNLSASDGGGSETTVPFKLYVVDKVVDVTVTDSVYSNEIDLMGDIGQLVDPTITYSFVDFELPDQNNNLFVQPIGEFRYLVELIDRDNTAHQIIEFMIDSQDTSKKIWIFFIFRPD